MTTADPILRDLVTRRLEATAQPPDTWPMLVLAALDGAGALARYLETQTEPRRPEPPAVADRTRGPRGAYLRAITVEGFRGVGQKKSLEMSADLIH